MKTQIGFTLIELMVTMAIAMILTMWAVPNMRNVLLNNRITAKTNEFIRTIHYVKNETITRNNNGLVIQPFDSATWNSGWKIRTSKCFRLKRRALLLKKFVIKTPFFSYPEVGLQVDIILWCLTTNIQLAESSQSHALGASKASVAL